VEDGLEIKADRMRKKESNKTGSGRNGEIKWRREDFHQKHKAMKTKTG
jgi:hypothetical protein